MNPITITAPNQVTPPIVGSSSAVSVVAPVSSVPVNPITVKPPSSAVKPVTSSSAPPRIAILDYWKDGKVGGTCIEDDIGTPRGSGCSTKNLQDEADRLEEEAKRANSERERIAALERLNLVLARIQDTKFFGSTSISAEAALKRIFKTPTYGNASPAQKLNLLTIAADGLTSGELGGCDLKVFAGALEGINASRPTTINLIGGSATTSSGCKPTTRPASANPNANQGGAIPMGGGFRPRANSWRPQGIAKTPDMPKGGGGGWLGLALAIGVTVVVGVILSSNGDGNSNSNPQAQPNSQAAQGSPDPNDPCSGLDNIQGAGFRSSDLLKDHAKRHAKSVGARDASQYNNQASSFLRNAVDDLSTGRYRLKVDPDNGIISVWDTFTGFFGAYNPDGSTRTFFNRGRGDYAEDYFDEQDGDEC